MSVVRFTSDLHLGHEKVAGLRGFNSAEDHDIAILGNWHSTVQDEDIVWVLGDLCMGNPTSALAALKTLPGRKRLVLGNHDAGHSINRNAHRWAAPYAEVFEHVATCARTKIQGREVLLSHFPYDRDRGEARHLQWRLPDLGATLLHGHTHGTERLSWSRRGSLEIHVGLDAWDLLPVSDRQLLAHHDARPATGCNGGCDPDNLCDFCTAAVEEWKKAMRL